jgi:hypothetical protein
MNKGGNMLVLAIIKVCGWLMRITDEQREAL